MNIRSLVLGEFMTNSYVLWGEAGQDAVVVDAPQPADEIVKALGDLGLEPMILVNTHGHIDHIGGNPTMRSSYPGISVAASEETIDFFRRPAKNLSLLLSKPTKFADPEMILSDGDRLTQCGLDLEVIRIDGHAVGSICLLAEGAPSAVFTGDTLFAGSVGRSDFPGGDMETLLQGIHERIMCLPDETVVYPGHGPATTVGEERKNPFLTGRVRADC